MVGVFKMETYLKLSTWDSGLALRVKALATKPDDLGSIPRTHSQKLSFGCHSTHVWLHSTLPTPTHTHTHTYTHTH